MAAYPVNLEIVGRCCAVVGGGSVAERKVFSLLEAGAGVTVISPTLTELLQESVRKNQILHNNKGYQVGDVQGYFLVICATDDAAINALAAEEARKNGALVNVVDNQALCDFTVPAKVMRGDVLLTVSTGGKSPALARQLRAELAEHYGPEYGVYLELVAKIRAQMKEQLATSQQRETFWRENLDSEILALVRQGKIIEAEARIKNATGSTWAKS